MKSDRRGPNLPEDICFFKNGKPWFASCSHEEYEFVETDDIEDIFILEELNILNDDLLFKPEAD